MPYRANIFTNGGYYHIYNRGLEKHSIFNSKKDYQTFLDFINQYLSPPPKDMGTRTVTINQKKVELPIIPHKNYHRHITLLCYCLMPNHFHLLIKQQDNYSLATFMKSLSLR